MSILQSAYAKGNRVAPYPQIAGAATTHRFSMEIPADVAQDDILELAVIPQDAEPMDIILDCDDVDANGAPAIVMDVGIMSGEFGDNDPARTCGNEFFAGSTVGQAGGVERASKPSAFRVAKSNKARSIGVKITTAPATGQAGSIGLTLTVAAT
jgi:hypothetical protein